MASAGGVLLTFPLIHPWTIRKLWPNISYAGAPRWALQLSNGFSNYLTQTRPSFPHRHAPQTDLSLWASAPRTRPATRPRYLSKRPAENNHFEFRAFHFWASKQVHHSRTIISPVLFLEVCGSGCGVVCGAVCVWRFVGRFVGRSCVREGGDFFFVCAVCVFVGPNQSIRPLRRPVRTAPLGRGLRRGLGAAGANPYALTGGESLLSGGCGIPPLPKEEN